MCGCAARFAPEGRIVRLTLLRSIAGLNAALKLMVASSEIRTLLKRQWIYRLGVENGKQVRFGELFCIIQGL